MIPYAKIAGAIVFAFFAFGVGAVIARRKMTAEVLTLLVVVLYTNFIYAPVFSILRYMIPTIPYVAVFVGFGLSSLLGWISPLSRAGAKSGNSLS
jgi:hypothetical protein